jgi:hypothetical protein
VARGRRRKGDAALVEALACGASAEGAARTAGVSPRTVYRRLADPAFRAQVGAARAELVRREAGLLTVAGLGSIKALTALQESATSEAVRLGAARAVLELSCKLRESADLQERVAAVEGRLEALLDGADNPASP